MRFFLASRIGCQIAAVILAISSYALAALGGEKEFFSPMPQSLSMPLNRILVFWVNGDADHFVTRGDGDASGKLYRADKFEVERIESAAISCTQCTSVILHDQRGSDGFFKRARPWATFLRVFHGGRRVLERSIPEINMADPAVLTKLLKFSQALDQNAELDLIYRGHPILPAGAPEGDVPFDYSHPQDRFSSQSLARAIAEANLGSRLKSVVLASCGSAYLETALLLKPLASYLVAAQHPVIERLSVSFSFDGIFARVGKEDSRGLSETAALTLMERFLAATDPSDYAYEYSTTWFDLGKLPIGTLKKGLNRISMRPRSEFSAARTVWMPSDRVSGSDLEGRIDPYAYDCGAAFSSVGMGNAFLDGIRNAVKIWHQSNRSSMSGINCLGPQASN